MSTLDEIRSQIREKDTELLAVIRDRLALGDKAAKVKVAKGLPTVDSDAEQGALENMGKAAIDLGLSIPFARRLGELLIEESIRMQEESRPTQSKDQMLKEIFEITQKMLAQGKTVTRFEIGEPNFPPPAPVIRALAESFRKKKIMGYGPAAGLPELRKALAAELSRQHSKEVDPDQILITPGGRFAIFATISTFVEPLERVIIPQPAWPAYEECVNFVRGRVIPLNTKLEESWEIDLRTLELEMETGAKMLILNSPHNPTGKAVGRAKIEKILDLARKYNVMVLSDEVYEKYVSDAPSILDTQFENSVYVNSFSKQFSLTGWRIAFLVASKDRALRIRRLIQTAITCVPEFIQKAALVALREGRPQAQRNIRAIMKKVELTCRELEKIDVSFYRPDGSFYVFPKANKPNFNSASFAKHLLEKHHVAVSPGQGFGEYPEFFRLAVSLPESQIPGAIRSIGKAIDAWP